MGSSEAIDFAVVVPWVTDYEIQEFLSRWNCGEPRWLVLQQDKDREGCGVTKNKGIDRAIEMGADVVIVLDGDCYPDDTTDLEQFAIRHVLALQPVEIDLFQTVTDPPSRGTPYYERKAAMPVAASMGFWRGVGDYCAARQLAHDETHSGAMFFQRDQAIYGRWFPLCGMNLAFRPSEWLPWCRFIDVPRFDDIWMGWLWQKEAYRRGYCFNLGGPTVTHARQSNVWRNLREETRYLEANETLWKEIALSKHTDYHTLAALLPMEN